MLNEEERKKQFVCCLTPFIVIFFLLYIPQVWMKSVKLEWQLGNITRAKELLEKGVKEYSDFAKVKTEQEKFIYFLQYLCG